MLLEVEYEKDWKADDGKYWRANAALNQVNALGELENQYIAACTGTPMNYNTLTHEVRVDHTDPWKRVLTTQIKLGRYDDTEVVLKTGVEDDVAWHENMFAGVEIVAWERSDNYIRKMYDLFDVAAPDDKGWNPKEQTWTTLGGCQCAGDDKYIAVDYHHISSVSVGPNGDLLVSSRNLNTIWAFNASAEGGGGLKWTLSSLDGKSDYGFERELDKFYTPHDAQMLEDGRMLLIDDGSSRPGCVPGGPNAYMGCWSRAALYEFDEDSKTVKVVWQYEDPHGLNSKADDDGPNKAGRTKGGGDGEDIAGSKRRLGGADVGDAAGEDASEDADAGAAKSKYYHEEVMTRDGFNFDGGSAQRLANGRILVAFTSPYDNRKWNEQYSMRAYEVDKDGESIVEIIVPHSGSLGTQGAYRFIPMNSVDQESSAAPFSVVSSDLGDAASAALGVKFDVEEEEGGPNGDDPAGGIDYKHVESSIAYQEGASHSNPVESVVNATANPIGENATTLAQHHKHNAMFPAR